MEVLRPVFDDLIKWRGLSQEDLQKQPAFQALLQYLAANGAPQPSMVDFADANGARRVMFRFTNGDKTEDLAVDYVITAAPDAMDDLRRQGVAGGDIKVYAPFVWPPADPAKPATPAKQADQPDNPVGAAMDEQGLHFLNLRNDSQIGQVWKDGRGTFVFHATKTPFGLQHPYWELQGAASNPVVVPPAPPAPPDPIAARIPATEPVPASPMPFDDNTLQQLIALLRRLGYGITPPVPQTPPPAPPAPPTYTKSLRVFGKSGREITNGGRVTVEEMSGGRMVFTGTPGDTIWFKNWYNDRPVAGASNGIPTALGGWVIGPDGTFTHTGFGVTGPSVTERQGKERCQFFMYPASASVGANAEAFADFTLTQYWNTSNGLAWERTTNPLTWDIHRNPLLTVIYSAAELGNPPAYEDVKFAFSRGLPIPQDPNGYAPGTPQT